MVNFCYVILCTKVFGYVSCADETVRPPTILIIILTIPEQHTGALGLICVKANYSSDAPRALKTTNLAALKRGTGGRSSFNGMVVSIFGCTGFVGRYVANKFGKIGSQLIFPYRADHYEALRLRLVGDLGQTMFHFYDIRDMNSIKTAIKYSNVVVNLVGRDWETKNFKFDDVHVQGARMIARHVWLAMGKNCLFL